MEIKEDVRNYAAEQDVAEEEALNKWNGGRIQRVCRKGKRDFREDVNCRTGVKHSLLISGQLLHGRMLLQIRAVLRG